MARQCHVMIFTRTPKEKRCPNVVRGGKNSQFFTCAQNPTHAKQEEKVDKTLPYREGQEVKDSYRPAPVFKKVVPVALEEVFEQQIRLLIMEGHSRSEAEALQKKKDEEDDEEDDRMYGFCGSPIGWRFLTKEDKKKRYQEAREQESKDN